MKKLGITLVSLLFAAYGINAWAGPAEEVAQLGAARLQAFQQGNVEGFTGAFADDAVLQPSFSPFRVEGKDAIRAFFAQLFMVYPKRTFSVRQPITRAYGENFVIQNSYLVINLTTAAGVTEISNARFTGVWHKVDGQWRIIEQHVSRLPTAHD